MINIDNNHRGVKLANMENLQKKVEETSQGKYPKVRKYE